MLITENMQDETFLVRCPDNKIREYKVLSFSPSKKYFSIGYAPIDAIWLPVDTKDYEFLEPLHYRGYTIDGLGY